MQEQPFSNLTPPFKQFKKNRGRKLLEKDVEDYGRKTFKKLGWTFEKFTSPEKRSVPDDICAAPTLFYPSAFVFFIEFKRPGEIATHSQQEDHRKRRAKGMTVFVVDCFSQLDLVIEIVQWIIVNERIPELPLYLLK